MSTSTPSFHYDSGEQTIYVPPAASTALTTAVLLSSPFTFATLPQSPAVSYEPFDLYCNDWHDSSPPPVSPATDTTDSHSHSLTATPPSQPWHSHPIRCIRHHPSGLRSLARLTDACESASQERQAAGQRH